MARNKSHKKLLNLVLLSFVLLTLIFSVIPFTSAQDLETSTCELGQVYLDGKGCLTPAGSVSTNSYEIDSTASKISSSLGEVDIIKITNPYAVAGQPVIVEFTLKNIGDTLGFPYDQITLPADVYNLELGVDKDVRVILADGRIIDVWGMMTGMQKIGFLLKLSTSEAVEAITNELKGETCGYVEMTKYLPTDVKDKLQDMNNGKAVRVYSWNCIKVVDMPLFEEEVQSRCKDGIDSACISKLNLEVGNAITDVVTVLLTSGTESNIEKGACIRPYNGGFFKEFWGTVIQKANVVECSIGRDGLAPGESVTFRFVALVPADAPTISPKALAQLDDLKTTDGELYGGYTESASCASSSNPIACHSVYAGVYPAKQKTILSYLVGQVGTALGTLKCGVKWVWDLGKSDFTACQSTISSQGQQSIGEPLWEGQGIFYVLGAALSASINFILWGAFVSGSLSAIVRKGNTAVIVGK